MIYGGIVIVYDLLIRAEEALDSAAPLLQIAALKGIGNAGYLMEDYARAHTCFLRCLDLSLAEKAVSEQASAYGNLGNIAMAKKDPVAALQYFQAALVAFQQAENSRGEWMVLDNLANLETEADHFETAIGYRRRALELSRVGGDSHNLGVGLNNLAYMLLIASQPEEATEVLREVVRLCQEQPLPRVLTHALTILVTRAIQEGQDQAAAHLMGMVDSLRLDYRLPMPPRIQEVYLQSQTALKARLSARGFSRLYNRGKAMAQSRESTLAYAFELLS